jgi:hypothetical protein
MLKLSAIKVRVVEILGKRLCTTRILLLIYEKVSSALPKREAVPSKCSIGILRSWGQTISDHDDRKWLFMAL